MRRCDHCEAVHTDNAAICLACTDRLRGILEQARHALVELDVSLSRQARIGQNVGRRPSGDDRLPYNVEASEATDFLLAQTITRWALDYWRATESPLASTPPDDPIAYILERLGQIRFRRFAVSMLEQIEAANAHAWRTVDLAEEYLEAGSCDCGRRLRAHPDVEVVVCVCGQRHDVSLRREQMVAFVESLCLPAKQIERFVDLFLRLGATERIRKRIPSGSVRGWASKGEVRQRGFSPLDGRTPIYRVGDVFDRAFREISREAA